jgi:peptidyl-prolyl cis-trans isomerase C
MKLLIFVGFTLSIAALAQSSDTVVAKIDGKPITAAELNAILQAQPPEAQQTFRKDLRAFVERLGLFRKLAAMAEKAKLDQASPTKEALEQSRMQTLAQAEVTAAADAIPVTLDEQKKFYESNRDRFTQAKVKMLFVSFRSSPPPASADPKAKKILTEAEAKAKTDKLLADIRAGADFIKVLKENSDDAESVARDGDFGQPIKRSDQAPENIKSAIFSLKPGEVSAPVRVNSGFYLFRLEELETQPFDQVSSDIFTEIRQKRFNEWLEKTQKSVEVKIENEEFFSKASAPAN